MMCHRLLIYRAWYEAGRHQLFLRLATTAASPMQSVFSSVSPPCELLRWSAETSLRLAEYCLSRRQGSS